MADQRFEQDVLSALVEQGGAVGIMAEKPETFRRAYEAFRAEDREAFQEVLKGLELTPQRLQICEWIRSKECVFLCLHLAGPPAPVRRPSPRVLAKAIVRITSDDDAVAMLAKAVEQRDGDLFQRLVDEHKLQPLVHVFCHWVCIVRLRIICRWVASLEPIPRPDLVAELKLAGEALGSLLKQDGAFDGAVAASDAGDAKALGSIFNESINVKLCPLLCEFFCSWRCTLACLTLVRGFAAGPFPDELREARSFARATQKLAQDTVGLPKLSAAVGRGDAKAYGALVKERKLERIALQLCHWICALRCRLHCHLVCPPPQLNPWFTHVGHFNIDADIDLTTGLTNKALSYPDLFFGGGPNFAFGGNLELRGFCPVNSPTFPGEPMRYRFRFELPSGGEQDVTAGLLYNVDAGKRLIPWPENVAGIATAALVNTFQTITVSGQPQPSPVPPAVGDPWFGPSEHVIVPDGAGWITVDPLAIGGGFQTLIGFDSRTVIAGGEANATAGVAAGTDVAAADHRSGTMMRIVFEATRVSNTSTIDYSNELARIYINNWSEVNLLDILQFHTGGGTPCSPLSSALGIEYTADHELMAAWSVGLTTAATLPAAPNNPVFPSGTGTRGVNPPSAPAQPPVPAAPPPPWPWADTAEHDISLWPTCSYTASLHTRAALTNGLRDNEGRSSHMTFCIGGRAPQRVPLGQRPVV